MKENPILDEIHRFREQHARECDYDIHKIFAEIRRNTEKLKARGVRVVNPDARPSEDASLLRDEPPKR